MRKTFILVGLVAVIALVLGFHFFICFSCLSNQIIVQLYYYNAEKDRDAEGNLMCSEQGLESVDRKIPTTKTPIEDTLQLLLLGDLTEEERGRGIDTEYPLEGLTLVSALMDEGVLTLHFEDPENKTSGGSCRISILRAQIETTAEQFSEVKEVRITPEWLFQP